MHDSARLITIDPFAITGSGLQDRLDDDARADARLLASIRDHGQQVPVLVRPHPDQPDHYQIIYGRRSVLALRDLGRPVLAIAQPMDPVEAVLANGAENSLRRGLSYIEKANLARQLATLHPRKITAEALNIDATLLSRMLSLTRQLPPEVIALIGSAPGVGVLRWQKLADLMDETGVQTQDLCLMVNMSDLNGSTAGRFRAALVYLDTLKSRAKPTRRSEVRMIRTDEGLPFARVKIASKTTSLTLNRRIAPGFDIWLVGQLPNLLARWSDPPGPLPKVN